jgi:hypothetical protein
MAEHGPLVPIVEQTKGPGECRGFEFRYQRSILGDDRAHLRDPLARPGMTRLELRLPGFADEIDTKAVMRLFLDAAKARGLVDAARGMPPDRFKLASSRFSG